MYVGYGSNPAGVAGAIKIATNNPIPVTVDGQPDLHTGLNLGGYYAISEADLKALLKDK